MMQKHPVSIVNSGVNKKMQERFGIVDYLFLLCDEQIIIYEDDTVVQLERTWSEIPEMWVRNPPVSTFIVITIFFKGMKKFLLRTSRNKIFDYIILYTKYFI